MHDVTPWVMVAGFLLVLATMFLWWRDVIKEAVHQGHHTKVVQLGLRYGMILRSEEHTSELQSLMRISYAVFCLKKKKKNKQTPYTHNTVCKQRHSSRWT